MEGVNFSFTDQYGDPDVSCTEESTADGYSLWVLKETNEPTNIYDTVYYYEPRIGDLFRLMHDSHSSDVEAYVEIELDHVSEYMFEALCEEYQSQQEKMEELQD